MASSLFLVMCSNSCPLNQWYYLNVSSSTAPSPFALNLSQNQGLFQWVSPSCFITGEGNGSPLQCSCLENPMDRGAWWATVHGVTESDVTEVTEHSHIQLFASGGQTIKALVSITPSNEYLRLISFRIAWFDLLAVQMTLKSLLQYHNSKAYHFSSTQSSLFFMDQHICLWLLKKP